MKPDDDIRRMLQQADGALTQRGLPPEVDERLRKRLELEEPQSAPARSYPRVWALGGLAVLVAAATWALTLASHAPELNGFSRVELSAGARIALTADAAVELAGGDTARLSSAPERFSLTLRSRRARVRKAPTGAAVLQGTVEVQVEKRRGGEPPLQIGVSGGAIEVTGTRFTIIESGTSGSVMLHEGTTTFRAPDGRARALVAGDTLSWPLSPPPSEEPRVREGPTPPPPNRRRSRSPEPMPEVFARVLELRSRGQYREAVTHIEAALSSERQPAARQVLLWEAVSILANQLNDAERGCRHAQVYLREFPAGRFVDRTREAQRALRCGTEQAP